MSFRLTTAQVKNRTKTVTRRLGWLDLKVGEQLQAIEKGQGLKKGETVNKLCVIETVEVRREPLHAIQHDDCRKEGFPELTPWEFCDMFCKSHKHTDFETTITRIEFKYR